MNDKAERNLDQRQTPPQVLMVSGSVRARCPVERLDKLVGDLASFDDAYNLIYELASDKRICNTEGALIAAGAGVRSRGLPLRHVRLNQHFPVPSGSAPRDLESVLSLLEQSGGMVLGSPVYFGDRSSQVESLLEAARAMGEMPLLAKTVGIVSVGAKRNGGQETTNILGLQDCLDMGANVLGNGPPTSQYGGTVVAGDVGAVLDDNFGLQTSYGTGRRVALFAAEPEQTEPSKESPRLLMLFSGKPDDRIAGMLAEATPKGVAVEQAFLEDFSLGRCLACSPCPPPENGQEDYFPCRQRDGIEPLRNMMLAADGIVLVGTLHGQQGLLAYQLFAERTRFIRRNHFELANTPLGIIQFARPGGQNLFSLRACNLGLRQNALLVGPGYSGWLVNGGFSPGVEALARYLRHFTGQVLRYRMLRRHNRNQSRYQPVGYAEA